MMNEQDVPKICEMLGVQVTERFWVKDGTIEPDERDAIYIACDGIPRFVRNPFVAEPEASLLVLFALQNPGCLIKKLESRRGYS